METSLRAYSRHRGTSLRTIQRAVKSGRLEATVLRDDASGRIVAIDLEKADLLWRRNTDPTQAERKTRIRNAKATEPDSDYFAHRSAREEVNAALAQLELDQRLGKLVPAAQAATEFAAVCRQVRDAVLRVFEQGEVLLGTNPANAQIRSTFRRMGRDALETLSQSL